MRAARDETHDPALRSWVESANAAGTDFPIQNLPFGVFRGGRGGTAPRVGVAIGDRVLDLARVHDLGLLRGVVDDRSVLVGSLNALMGMPRGPRLALRRRLSDLLHAGSRELRGDTSALLPMDQVELLLPATVGDYTDFYASIDHALNVGRMLRPDEPLLPNYKYVPIAYHGRASSVAVSGAPVRRPLGQTRPDESAPPAYGPSRALDYELEVALWIGPGNELGEPIPIDRAEEHVFGVGLLNDWSARDVQAWEYRPLGPFLAKSFVTTVSPWVVTLEALAPFRVPANERAPDEPAPLPYLTSSTDAACGGIAMTVEAFLRTTRMRDEGAQPVRLSRADFQRMYWTPAQMVAHHTSNGCNLRPGDLLGSGTVSGPSPESRGCLLELTRRGAEPIRLPSGELRKFLEDGDEVILRGACEREGAVRVGLGECRGTVLPFREV